MHNQFFIKTLVLIKNIIAMIEFFKKTLTFADNFLIKEII
jgi:hypothetical protein